MKTGMHSLRNFFIKEPKFSVLIALIAINVLIVLFLNADLFTVLPFSLRAAKIEYSAINIPFQQFCSIF